jgi:hypothetical protein
MNDDMIPLLKVHEHFQGVSRANVYKRFIRDQQS